MKIATLTESSENENRVAITPDSAKFLIKFGHEVIIQSGAGEKARFSDNDYKKSGCKILKSSASIFKEADVIVKVNAPNKAEQSKFQKKQIRKKPLNFIGLNNKKKLSRVNSSENISNHSTNIISVSEGDKVEHERFGIGVVIKIEGSGGNKSALINFKNSGSKKLLLRFAKLSPIK